METAAMNFGDPERFQSAVEALIGILGKEWVAEKVASLPVGARSTERHEGDRLLRALADYPLMIDTLRGKADAANRQEMLFLAMVAFVASECMNLPGGNRFAKELRDRARADRYSAFFDKLFEGEAAVYWRDQMRAEGIEFPAGNHPDFWATVRLQGTSLRIANECKRIAPNDAKETAVEQLSEALGGDVQKLYDKLGAMKVIVWLHAPLAELSTQALVEVLRETADDARLQPDEWLARTDAKGLFQVSVASDPGLGEWAERAINVEDVPAVGPLRVCIETRYLGKAQDPTRLKYVLSVRSDVLPDRVGAFERNVVAAIRQLTESQGSVTGVVNVRIRPPRALGDLYEMDAIVRRVLRERTAAHIGLAILYWNESERREGEWQLIEDHKEREVSASYSLQTHFIANSTRPIDFSSIDSSRSRFPEDAVVMRDPETGSLAPLAPETANLFSRVTERIEGDAATIYLRLHEPFPLGAARQSVGLIEVDSRQFLPVFDDAQHLRVIELQDRKPVRVATLDLRAWRGVREFLFDLRCADGEWTIAISEPRGHREIIARCAYIRPAFI